MLISSRAAKTLRRPLAAALTFAVLCTIAQAEGTFIPAPSRKDIMHDAPRNILYITSGGSVLRWDTVTKSFLSSFVLGGTLYGMDLSPDGNTLLVGDTATTSTESWIHVVDLVTGTSSRSIFPRTFDTASTYTVAFGNDGKAIVSTGRSLRKLDLQTNTWSTVAPVYSGMVSSSGDGSVVGFAESGLSNGAFGRYRVSDGNVLKTDFAGSTGWFNFEIGVNHNGTQFALPTYGGTHIYGANLTKIATVGTYAGQLPIGVAYHSVEPLVYFAWTQGTNVTAHETATFSQVASYNFESTNGWNGNSAFINGRTRLSRDGSMLFSTVPNGVRYVQMYAPLAANNAATSTDEDAALPIELSGSIGNGGALTYLVLTPPQHGTLTGTPPNLTYTPEPNFHGTDSFNFGVDYGPAGAEATISITVNPIEDAPIANPQSVNATEDTAKTVTLSGADAENSPLTYSVVSVPAHGTLTGTAPNLTYIPAANYSGPDSFSFKVNDGISDSGSAMVSVMVASVNDAPEASGQQVATEEDAPKEIVLGGSDIDSASLAYSIVTAPAHGTLSGALPNVTYTPDANYSGPDSFSFKANDGETDSAPATVGVTVTPVNDVPVAAAQALTTNEDAAGAIVLGGSDSDGDAISYAIVTAPVHGTLTGIAPNLTYTPASNYSGPDSFSFKVNDGSVDSAAATVDLAVASVNDVPIAANDTVATVKNTAVNISVLANDSDVDADELTVISTTQNVNGTTTIIDGGKAIRFTPKPNFTGTGSFSYTVSDAHGGSATAAVQITVTKR